MGHRRSETMGTSVARGFGWGIGLCIASRLIGPGTVRVVAEAQPAAAAETSPVHDACHLHKQALDDCLNHEGSDTSKCQFYMDLLNECRRKSNAPVVASQSQPVSTS